MKSRCTTNALKDPKRVSIKSVAAGVLQRQCTCGGKSGFGGAESAESRRKKLIGERLPLLQTKLVINEPGDRYEQEANRVADQVIRMPENGGIAVEPLFGPYETSMNPEDLHRQPVEEEEEEGDEEPLQAMRQGPPQESCGVDAAPPLVHDAMRSPGQPLDARTLAFMESRFGHSFGHVRVHTGELAGASARAISSRAYTFGRDIAFATGQYAPASPTGRRLLAHELTHVIQQSGSFSHFVQREDNGSGSGQPPAPAQKKLPTNHPQAKPKSRARQSGTATWNNATINRHDAAERIFKEWRALLGGGGGLTRTFVNGTEITDNLVLEQAVPEPPIGHQKQGKRTLCWYESDATATGNTVMDIYSTPPWSWTAPRADVAKRFSHDKRCTDHGQGDAIIRVNGIPDDNALEEFIRLGEAEHETDSETVFNQFIADYVAKVNQHVGNTPQTRVSAGSLSEGQRELRQRTNRPDVFTDFVVEKNRLTDVRHANQRHSINMNGIQINRDCAEIAYQVRSGTL